MATTKQYREAYKRVRKASLEYSAIVAQYRVGRITNDEYIKARKAYDEANKEFDKAYALEQV